MITEFTCGMERCGRGEVIVARWLKNGKPDHLSTLGNILTVEAFRKEVEIRLGLRQADPPTPFVAAVKAGLVEGMSWR